MKEELRRILSEAGAVAVGFAEAGEIEADIHERYCRWIQGGNHGEMDYLRRHLPLRRHTDHVLPGARTVISIAFDFTPEEWLPENSPKISAYAYGEDYHNAIRETLNPLLAEFKRNFGGKWRLCIDSAPVAERYWALKSGLGKRGINGSVIVEGLGSMCFLSEILTTVSFPPDRSSEDTCIGCGKCVEACVSGALRGDGTMDATKCINYLTLEKQGDLEAPEREIVKSFPGFIFGCDLCLKVCPHNNKKQGNTEKLEAFALSGEIKNLTPEKILDMEEEEFKKRFAKSPFLYAGYRRIRGIAELLAPK